MKDLHFRLRARLAWVAALALCLIVPQGAHAATVTFQGMMATQVLSGLQTSQSAIDSVILAAYPSAFVVYNSDAVQGQAAGIDSGIAANSYDTTFTPPTDPSGATIIYTPGAPIISNPGYLLVKDGASPDGVSPAWYLFDITAWNGTSPIVMNDFWPGSQQAISHVSIYAVPEPASMGLVSLGAVALAGAYHRRRRASRTPSA